MQIKTGRIRRYANNKSSNKCYSKGAGTTLQQVLNKALIFWCFGFSKNRCLYAQKKKNQVQLQMLILLKTGSKFPEKNIKANSVQTNTRHLNRV